MNVVDLATGPLVPTPPSDPAARVAAGFARLYRDRHGRGDPDAEALALDGWRAYWGGDIERAASSFGDALEFAPEHGLAAMGLGYVAWWQGRHAEALDRLRAVAADGWYGAPAWWSLGLVARDCGDDAEAERCFRRALALDPDDAISHVSLSIIHLRRGEFRRGWRAAEWRPRDTPRPVLPRWRGEALGSRTLLVSDEKGHGDRMLFARYLPAVVERARANGGAVVVETAAPLVYFWRANFPGVAEVVETGRRTERAPDCRADGESLPLLLGAGDAVPGVPYLRADRGDIAAWRARLRLRPDVLNVGIAWASGRGRPARPLDGFTARGHLRNVALADLGPLARVPGVRWFGLQKGRNEDDQAPAGMELERLGPDLRDFGDTAAVAAVLDLVITVDTSVANLAGALGLGSWVLLPHASDWRWMTGGQTAWFPTLRLFRQERRGDWRPVVERVADELTHLAARRGRARPPCSLGCRSSPAPVTQRRSDDRV